MESPRVPDASDASGAHESSAPQQVLPGLTHLQFLVLDVLCGCGQGTSAATLRDVLSVADRQAPAKRALCPQKWSGSPGTAPAPYEGCARAYLGEIEGANIVKLHRFSGKVSYLSYPNFDAEAHPMLTRSLKISLRTLQLDCYDYSASSNPPILHRKEAFLPKDYPGYEHFSELTAEEEKRGLLTDTAKIGTREGWESRLKEAGLRIEDHQLLPLNDEVISDGQPPPNEVE